MLSTTSIGLDPGLPLLTPAEGAPLPLPEGASEPDVSTLGAASEGPKPQAPWRISTAFPWRISAWRRPGPGRPPASPVVSEPSGPRGGIASAVMLPRLRELRLEGQVAPGEGVDFFGLEVGPGTRAFDVSYIRLTEEPWGGPVRVWLSDAEGNVIDSWTLDPSFEGLELEMLALRTPAPTMLYFGIEAAWGAGGGSGEANYALEVRRGGGMGASPFLFPSTSPVTGESPPTGSDPGGFGDGPSSGPALGQGLTGIDPGPGIGAGLPDSSGGGGSGFAFLEVALPRAIGLGRGVPRPLPTQAAASVGGLLPAGPAIRGDSGSPARVSGVDDFADPVLLAVEPVLPADLEGAEGEGPLGLARSEIPADLTGEAFEAEPVLPTSPPSVRLAGVGGGSLSLLVAGLRLAWGGPGDPTPLPEVPIGGAGPLVSIGAGPLAEPIGPGSPALPPVPRTDRDAEPTRPRVLRTALIGAAALAVGLILPDLASERPLLRHRRARPLLPWRRLARS